MAAHCGKYNHTLPCSALFTKNAKHDKCYIIVCLHVPMCFLRTCQILQANDQLPLRVFLTHMHDELKRKPSDPAGSGALLQPFRPACFTPQPGGAHAGSMESRLLMERVKIFSDGSLGAETAALRKLNTTAAATVDPSKGAVGSNSSSSGDKGVLVYERPELANMIADAYRARFRVEIHAIGDEAAEQVLSALDDSEAILAQDQQQQKQAAIFCGRPESAQKLRHWRPILTHCQVLGADLIERMAEKGVVANVQPSFVPTGTCLPRFIIPLRYSSASR